MLNALSVTGMVRVPSLMALGAWAYPSSDQTAFTLFDMTGRELYSSLQASTRSFVVFQNVSSPILDSGTRSSFLLHPQSIAAATTDRPIVFRIDCFIIQVLLVRK